MNLACLPSEKWGCYSTPSPLGSYAYAHVVAIVYLHDLFCADSTLTVPHLLSALQGVADWKGLGQWLDVPWSRRTGKESMLEECLQNHPAPSWKLVAWALYRRGFTEHSVLKQLYGKHVSGMWLCTDDN
jgi:hypothetical protein